MHLLHNSHSMHCFTEMKIGASKVYPYFQVSHLFLLRLFNYYYVIYKKHASWCHPPNVFNKYAQSWLINSLTTYGAIEATMIVKGANKIGCHFNQGVSISQQADIC